MRRNLRTLVVVAALAAVALSAVACGNATAEANAAIEAANKQIAIFNKADTEITQIIGQVNDLGNSPADFKHGVDLIKQAEAKMPAREKAITASKAEWDKITKMGVSADLQKWAAMRVEIADLQLESEKRLSATLKAMEELFAYMSKGKPDTKKVAAMAKDLQELSKANDEIQSQIDAKEAAADKFFAEKGLAK